MKKFHLSYLECNDQNNYVELIHLRSSPKNCKFAKILSRASGFVSAMLFILLFQEQERLMEYEKQNRQILMAKGELKPERVTNVEVFICLEYFIRRLSDLLKYFYLFWVSVCRRQNVLFLHSIV